MIFKIIFYFGTTLILNYAVASAGEEDSDCGKFFKRKTSSDFDLNAKARIEIGKLFETYVNSFLDVTNNFDAKPFEHNSNEWWVLRSYEIYGDIAVSVVANITLDPAQPVTKKIAAYTILKKWASKAVFANSLLVENFRKLIQEDFLNTDLSIEPTDLNEIDFNFIKKHYEKVYYQSRGKVKHPYVVIIYEIIKTLGFTARDDSEVSLALIQILDEINTSHKFDFKSENAITLKKSIILAIENTLKRSKTKEAIGWQIRFMDSPGLSKRERDHRIADVLVQQYDAGNVLPELDKYYKKLIPWALGEWKEDLFVPELEESNRFKILVIAQILEYHLTDTDQPLIYKKIRELITTEPPSLQVMQKLVFLFLALANVGKYPLRPNDEPLFDILKYVSNFIRMKAPSVKTDPGFYQMHYATIIKLTTILRLIPLVEIADPQGIIDLIQNKIEPLQLFLNGQDRIWYDFYTAKISAIKNLKERLNKK